MTTTRWYLAVAPHLWGRGTTPEEAKEQLKKVGADLRKKYKIYEMPEGTRECWVDDMGCLCWKLIKGADRTGRTKELQ